MLRLYYGRESIDKERAMFEKIAESLCRIGAEGAPSRIILIVPDQYTLQAERNAIFHLKVKGLMDLEVLSFSRLAGRVLDETGGSRRVPIDKHGRHMLLAKIMRDQEENLLVFRGMGRSHSFIDMANDLISEMKQYNSSPEELRGIIGELEENSLLSRKLKDIALIFENYEEKIKDKYIDTEDHLNLFLSKIAQSILVKNAEFWIFGFDSFTPKSINIIRELALHSHGVNMVLTYDDAPEDEELFRLTKDMMWKLEKAVGPGFTKKERLDGPDAPRQPAIRHLERQIFAYPYQPFAGGNDTLHFCRAANFYGEAETAAAFICSLVRDRGLRFRDIVVICNDMEARGSIIKRVFHEYGISFFLDQKHRVLHNPAVIFISSILDVLQSGWAYEDVFRLVKTGLCPIDEEEAEELENYAIRYRFRGTRWKKDLVYGKKDYEEEEFERLNQCRRALADFIGACEEKMAAAVTVRQKTAALKEFLNDEADLENQLETLCQELEEAGELEAAMEMQQIWESVLGLLDQLTELIGDEAINIEDYASMLQAGFDSIELGLIPTTIDQVVVGTMQRTRVGQIQALVVMGANDGILPTAVSGDDLLNQDERALLLQKNILICKDDDLRSMEERLAIYKQFSRPQSYLWIGYSAADMEGKELRPSILLDKLCKLFPHIPLEKDLRNREDVMVLVDSPASSLKYLSEALRKAAGGEEELDPVWKAAFNWYREQNDRGLELVIQGLRFTNRMERLESSLVEKLFGLRISPSRLEKFARCPFAHFVHYGLAPKERRIFQVSGREVGDVYHRCLMLFAESLTVKGMELTHENSPWMKLTREECSAKVAALMEKVAAEYNEGMLEAGEEERYRTARMQEVCERAAWALVEHVRQGRISEIYFEEAFGSGSEKRFPPIRVAVENQEILIEGKIDRIDVLPEGYVKVIDYKSGKEKFDIREALGGWRLQLMVYLKAVTEGMEALNRSAKPAGVFYFEIADPVIDASEYDEQMLKSKLEEEMKRRFKLDGVVLDDPDVIENIAGEFSGYSEILPVRKNKDGTVTGTAEGRLLTEEEFRVFMASMDQLIAELCGKLISGVIQLRPKKTKNETACTYCDYKSICNFELSFDGCSYDVVK
ncbi:MAG: PD-(D/E)XK nuclease family protein [Anaerovoracaceae bacterium]|jgi:ATP-dependent helicase/nuclease subunit B